MQSSGFIKTGREEIEKWLRDALNHLYDIGYLQNHPLGDVLVRPEESTGKRGADLRKVLISAIQARKPPRGMPAQSPDWRGYQILEQHILAGLSPAEVMQKLNISRSLFFLEKARIFKVLFDDLWDNRLQTLPQLNGKPEKENLAGDLPEDNPQLVTSESLQLLQNVIFEPVEIRSLLNSVRPLIEPMVQSQQTQLEVITAGEGLIPRGDRVLIRQVILSLVGELLHLVAGGHIKIFAFDQAGAFGIQIEGRKAPQELLELRLEERCGLQPGTAIAILKEMNGLLNVEVGEDGVYRAILTWLQPRHSNQMLLIDDHPDIADLFTRYLHGTGWEVVWANSADTARRILSDLHPAIIVLDVILPVEDGWEFLITLKADPITREIPVVVCSAINEPDFVRSLGAQGYLPKPFSGAQLVQALAPWFGGFTPNLAKER